MENERVGELTATEANAETRLYRIIGLVTTGAEYDYNSHIVVEYLDTEPDPNAYEYMDTLNPAMIAEHQSEGWVIYDMQNTQHGKTFYLRRTKPAESDPADG
ncbi:MAG: hypothetical protein ACYTEQ_26200 [Planctomycetota bacterium]